MTSRNGTLLSRNLHGKPQFLSINLNAHPVEVDLLCSQGLLFILNRNPPNWIFGPVWTCLYAAMGVASWRVFQAGGGPLPLGLYAAQLALNFIWTPLFFKVHNLKAASYEITALLGTLVATILAFKEVDETAAMLMLPYLAWTSFATCLTWNIYLNNPEQVRFRVITNKSDI